MVNSTEGETQFESAHTLYVGPSRLGAATADKVHYLVVEAGAHAGQRFLLSSPVMSIGREAPCDIVLRDPGVSRTHCRLERRFDQLAVADLGSTNGSFIDGVFELVRPDGTETSLRDFVMHLMAPPIPGVPETVRIHRAAIETQGKSNFDDDFTIVVADFE